MKDMHELKEKLCRELEEYERKEKISMGDLETIHKLTDTIKNIGKISVLEEEGGYSEAGGGWEARGSYNRGGNMMPEGTRGGSSYRRQRRDSRGRYSRDGGYSYTDGMEELNELLDDMMEGATEKQRDAIHRFREAMRSA